jgi:hypothetical protein
MMNMPLSTILDLAIILLLIPTIVYAVILNRRLSALRKSRDELAKVVSNFNEATMRAEAGIPKLKKATHEANSALQDRVEKAHSLRDDLAFMIERAEEMADRLEGAVRVGRSDKAPAAASGQTSTHSVVPTTMQHAPPPSMRPAAAPDSSVAARTLAGAAMAADGDDDVDLRAVIGAARAEANVQGQREAGPVFGRARPPADPVVDEDDRSEAERELLKALQSAR